MGKHKVNHSKTSSFQQATFLNDPNAAYEILNEHLYGNWYPENADSAWTDIAVLEGKYYAAFGEDSVNAENAKLIYIEIEPSKEMKETYKYFNIINNI